MNVLLIGSGGREHALAYKISESKSLSKLYIAPGNPGTENLGENVSLNINMSVDVIKFCSQKNIELVVIGPEQPLVDGLTDRLVENGINVFGPSASAARIEGDKVFAKDLMWKYNIPTAAYHTFGVDEQYDAFNHIKVCELPIVIKASGLAAGKGVLICNTREEALQALNTCMVDKKFGTSGEMVVVEEFMTGQEASVFAISDGKDYFLLPAAQDHKRIYDNDEGPNTGGMGAYAPAPIVTDKILKDVEEQVIKPALEAMEKEGNPYKGCLYCGLMLTDQGPKVVEFNCRFGDPETQAILPLLQGDFLSLLYSSAAGKIDKEAVTIKDGSCVTVIAASKGYPDEYEKGLEITGLDEIKDDSIIIFHAGTKRSENKIVTSGGRVLGVSAIKEEADLGKTKTVAYEALNKISFDGIYFRTDIADKAIN
ncbi:MAG: phosphoribosylamine--glycine ligase [Melioribacteraceae bacterium]|nr:MAG: phosphoribosylamine--glycine ligase [Melioribacteraceae bacterium]